MRLPAPDQLLLKAIASTSGISRRAFLEIVGLGSAGLLLGVHFGSPPAAAQDEPPLPKYELKPEAYVRVGRDGKVTLIVPKADMGQAVYTSIVQLVAEELDVDPAHFAVEHAPADDTVYGIAAGTQVTGGSTSIRAMWIPMRQVGALTRAMFVAAAARRWNVGTATCRTENGVVLHKASGRKATYGDLVDAVAETVPSRVQLQGGKFFVPPDPKTALADSRAQVHLKARKDFKVIGKSIHRVDGTGKVHGAPLFSIDIRVSGMLVGTVMACPVFGGKLKDVDESKARAISGVRHIVKLDNAVAVIGDHFWAAQQGLQALTVTWDEGTYATLSTADIVRDLVEAANAEGLVARKDGNASKALMTAAKRIDAVYEVPMLAHATMEPPNCLVHVRPDGCDVWVGTQVPAIAQRAVATVTGLSPDKVTIHNQYLGGGFGRRLEVDFIEQTARIAKELDRPVKIVWTREEDIQHDLYRPYYYDRLSAGLDRSGNIVAWTHRIVGSSVTTRFAPSELLPGGLDPDAIDGGKQLPYDFPNVLVDYVRKEPPGVPTGYWRGVGATHNVFVIESFIDELARAAGKDPFEFRRRHLSKAPRAKAVLEKVAKEAKWGKSLPARTGRGIAVANVFGSYLAQVAEVSVSKAGDIRVERVLCAVDCGISVNPGHVKAQIESGIIFGLAPVLLDAVTIEEGRIQQSNFHDYRVIRMSESPGIDVYVLDSGEAPGGIGETGTALIAPAVANAIFAATGTRVRKLPVRPEDLSTAS